MPGPSTRREKPGFPSLEFPRELLEGGFPVPPSFGAGSLPHILGLSPCAGGHQNPWETLKEIWVQCGGVPYGFWRGSNSTKMGCCPTGCTGGHRDRSGLLHPHHGPLHGGGRDGGGRVAVPKPQERGTFLEAPLALLGNPFASRGWWHHRVLWGDRVAMEVGGGGDGARDGVAMEVVVGETALVLAAAALLWFVGRAPRQTSCSQLRQAPACPVPGSGPASSLVNP